MVRHIMTQPTQPVVRVLITKLNVMMGSLQLVLRCEMAATAGYIRCDKYYSVKLQLWDVQSNTVKHSQTWSNV